LTVATLVLSKSMAVSPVDHLSWGLPASWSDMSRNSVR
jgi:hypothetical protein